MQIYVCCVVTNYLDGFLRFTHCCLTIINFSLSQISSGKLVCIVSCISLKISVGIGIGSGIYINLDIQGPFPYVLSNCFS